MVTITIQEVILYDMISPGSGSNFGLGGVIRILSPWAGLSHHGLSLAESQSDRVGCHIRQF